MKFYKQFPAKHSFSHILKVITLILFTSVGCAFIAIPDPLPIKQNTSSLDKLGILITQKEFDPKVMYRPKQEIILTLIQNEIIEENKSNEQFVLIDNFGDKDGFDYSQEHFGVERKNVLELQYSYRQSSVPIVMNIFGALTLGILPIKQNFQLHVTPIIHDSNGQQTTLTKIESPVLSEWRSWFLFPFGYTESNESVFLQNIIKYSLHSGLEEIKERKIALNSYSTKIDKLNLPFRMKLVREIECGGSLLFAYRQTINSAKGKKICKTIIHFANKTDKIVTLDSKSFILKVDNTNISPIESIPGPNGEMQNLSPKLSLQPKETRQYNGIALYFSMDSNLGIPSFLEYRDKNISEHPIFISVKPQKHE